MCREAYLKNAVKALQADVFAPAGYTVPTDTAVSCSFPGGRSNRNKTIGQCWKRELSGANVNEIFISPFIEDSVKCLDILAHELIHAIDDCEHGHRKEFSRIMRAIGLTGKPTATRAGHDLETKLMAIVVRLGKYPHKALKATSPNKKQATRMIKLECNECSAVWRMARSHAVNVKVCPCCQSIEVAIN